MAKRYTYTATAPDGTVHTRTTATKLYRFAVLVNNAIRPQKDGDKWGSWSWSARTDLAATVATARKCYRDVIVVPVDNPRESL